jgi:class 3 adenylate cyclase
VAAPRETRKIVTVVFCDVAGSTALGEQLDPEALRRVMQRYFGEARRVLEGHGGTVEKFIGDAVMAVFGVPAVREDDALRAVRAAAELREALVGLSAELEREGGVALAVRTGVNTGEVVAGDRAARDSLVTGDAVNVAARLEQAAEPGEVLLGEQTFRLVRDAVRAEPAPPIAAKGKAEPLTAFRLLEVVPGAPGVARRLDAPLVGRQVELARLRAAFDRAVSERKPQLVTLLGPPGIGKSRLALELVREVEGEATVLSGRCLHYGEGITFWPLAEALREVDIGSLLAGEEDAALIERRLAAVLGDGEAGRLEEVFWAVRRALEDLARRRPLVLSLEDVHWAESTLLDLVEYLADWTRDAPLVLLCLARPDLLEARPSFGGERIELAALTAEEAAVLLEGIGGGALSEAIRSRMLEAAEGNPLFLEQMLTLALESGEAELAVPPTIQALLAARLEALEPAEREVLERAAVVGKVFYWGAVGALCSADIRADAARHLLALTRKRLIGPERSDLSGEDAFGFRHMLIRDVAYGALPKSTRAELHERLAAWLDEAARRAGHDVDEVTAYHLEQAYRYAEELGAAGAETRELATRAAEGLARAGYRAMARVDMAAAANLLGRAASLLDEADPSRLELLPELGIALAEIGDFARAKDVLEAAVRHAEEVGDVRSEWRARLELTYIRGTVDRLEVSEELAETARAIAALEAIGDDIGLARAWIAAGFSEFALGRAEAGLEAYERALESAGRAGASHEADQALGCMAISAFFGPMPAAEARRFCHLLLERARGSKFVEGPALGVLGALVAMEGRFDEGRALVAQSRALMNEFGLPILFAAAANWAAPLELWAGDPVAAERVLRESIEVLEAKGETAFLSTLAALLAEALYQQGRLEEAQEATQISERASASDDFASQVEWRAVRAKVMAIRGEREEGETLAREAVAIVESTDYLDMRGDAWMSLAEVLTRVARPGAAEAVEQALALYERKGNLVSAARARARLAELGA